MYVATAMSVAPVTASSSWLLPLRSIPSPPPSVLPWITLHGHQQLNNGTRRSLSLHRPLLLPLPLAFVSGSTGGDVLEVEEIKERSQKWLWKGTYSINFFVQPPLINGDADHRRRRSPLLLVHGFGASIPHWRRFSLYLSLSYCFLFCFRAFEFHSANSLLLFLSCLYSYY